MSTIQLFKTAPQMAYFVSVLCIEDNKILIKFLLGELYHVTGLHCLF